MSWPQFSSYYQLCGLRSSDDGILLMLIKPMLHAAAFKEVLIIGI